MPSARRTSTEPGLAARSRSSRATGPSAARCASAGTLAHARASSAAQANREAVLFIAVLSIGVEHVLEPEPVGVEIEIGVACGTVAVLHDQQFGCPFDSVAGLIHLLAEDAQHHVGLV